MRADCWAGFGSGWVTHPYRRYRAVLSKQPILLGFWGYSGPGGDLPLRPGGSPVRFLPELRG